jgi:hypothetical protein
MTSERIANDMGVALLQTERLGRVESGVHAGDHRDLASWRHRQIALGKSLRVLLVRGKHLVDQCHGGILFTLSIRIYNKLIQN